MLAVTIGNVHGVYKSPPKLDFDRLSLIRHKVSDHVPLVLHGASGLDPHLLRECMTRGVCKFNVNTDLRSAAMTATRDLLIKSNKVCIY